MHSQRQKRIYHLWVMSKPERLAIIAFVLRR